MSSRERIRAVRDALVPFSPRGVLIVPAFDEEALLPRFLRSVAALAAEPEVALLIHANNCRDATAEVARRFGERLTGVGLAVVESVYDPPNVGLVRAESADGAVEAGCEWLLFLDADGTLPDADFLVEAARTVAVGRDGCWAGSSDEFADVRRRLRDEPSAVVDPAACEALLAFGSAFRCRALPRAVPVVRYTDGSNCMVTSAAYASCGGFEPKSFGGDSTLGDRYLAHTGRLPGFFDRPVVTSSRKPLAGGQLGGFVFYPARSAGLPTVRGDAEADALGPVTPERCFDAICDDLRALLLFTLTKRRSFIEAEGSGPGGLARAVVEAFETFCAGVEAPVRLEARGDALALRPRGDGPERCFSLAWDAAERFWQTGE